MNVINKKLYELLNITKDWEEESNKLCSSCPKGITPIRCSGPCDKWSELNKLAFRTNFIPPDFFSKEGRIELLQMMFELLTIKEFDNYLKYLSGGICSPERMIIASYMINDNGALAEATLKYLEETKLNIYK